MYDFPSPKLSNYRSGLKLMEDKFGGIDPIYEWMPTWSCDELEQITEHEYEKGDFNLHGISLEDFSDLTKQLKTVGCMRCKTQSVTLIPSTPRNSLNRNVR